VKSSLGTAQVGMQYNLSAPSAWQFVAGNGSDAVNSWGQPRAYAIVPTGVLGALS
jgi:hypothetical protein